MTDGRKVDLTALADRAQALSTNVFAQKSAIATVELAETLAVILDEEIAELQTHVIDPIACRPGCDHCCYRVVQATLPEIARAADYIDKNFTEEQKAGLKKRLYEYERKVAPNFGTNLHQLRPACPLLVDGLCSAYDARPFFCRGMNSHFAVKCKEWKEHPNRSVRIPLVAANLDAVEAVNGGLQSAIAQNHLSTRMNDFGRGLRTAVEDPEAVMNWHKGGLDFLSARSSVPAPDVAPQPSDPPLNRYGPGQEPTGKVDLSGLALNNYLRDQGLPREALSSLRGDHPLYRIAAFNVPRTTYTTDEMLEWREHFRRSVMAF